MQIKWKLIFHVTSPGLELTSFHLSLAFLIFKHFFMDPYLRQPLADMVKWGCGCFGWTPIDPYKLKLQTVLLVQIWVLDGKYLCFSNLIVQSFYMYNVLCCQLAHPVLIDSLLGHYLFTWFIAYIVTSDMIQFIRQSQIDDYVKWRIGRIGLGSISQFGGQASMVIISYE